MTLKARVFYLQCHQRALVRAEGLMSLVENISQSIHFVSEDTLLGDVAYFLAESDAGVIGITRDGIAVGTITDRELVTRAVALGRDLSKYKAKHVMERQPVTVEWSADDSDLIDATILMRRKKALNAIVIRGGLPVGVISIGSLSRHGIGNL